jgi:hypothetical protein
MPMTVLLLCSFLITLPPEDGPAKPTTPRPPNPFAPSLPQLTDEEEEQLDRVIEGFIAYDTRKLPATEGKKALAEFQKLGPESTFALIRGLNRAAKIEHSCPAVTIARKLQRILMASMDTELLEFARENIGAGITHSRHLNVLQDVRLACTLRKNSLASRGREVPLRGGDRPIRSMTVQELAEAAGIERGARLKAVLTELGRRSGEEALSALGAAATGYEGESRTLARELITKKLSALETAGLKAKLNDDKSEVRACAARVVAAKRLRLAPELIELLQDEEPSVRQAAREALVRLAGGADFGPEPNAPEEARAGAVQKWQAWWKQQGGR